MSNNDDKIYNLLEKVYVELQSTKKEVSENSTRLTKIELTLENIVAPNFQALFDTQTQILAKLEEHDNRFDIIEKKFEKHDLEIRVIKGGKRKIK